jgi:hypothetical protein
MLAQKSAEPISAIVLGMWTFSRLDTVEGDDCTLLWDASTDALIGEAF